MSLKWQRTGRAPSEGYSDFVSKKALREYQESAKNLGDKQTVAQGAFQGQ